MRKNIDIYLHGSKEDSYGAAEEAGLVGEALDNAMYLGYELKVTYSVDPETGDGTIIAVDDVPLRTEG